MILLVIYPTAVEENKDLHIAFIVIYIAFIVIAKYGNNLYANKHGTPYKNKKNTYAKEYYTARKETN